MWLAIDPSVGMQIHVVFLLSSCYLKNIIVFVYFFANKKV